MEIVGRFYDLVALDLRQDGWNGRVADEPLLFEPRWGL